MRRNKILSQFFKIGTTVCGFMLKISAGSEEIYNIPRPWAVSIFFAFPLLVVAYSIFLAWPLTRDFALWLVEENRLVEVLTFVAASLGGSYALRAASSLHSSRTSRIVTIFYIIWGIGLFFFAMEEIAWGQQFFGFETPKIVRDVNQQDELTLHNIGMIHGTSEIPQFFVGTVSLAWIALRWNAQPNMLTVPRVLLSLSVLITLLASGDLWQDMWYRSGNQLPSPFAELAAYFDAIDELNEFLIAVFGLLFPCINMRLIVKRSI